MADSEKPDAPKRPAPREQDQRRGEHQLGRRRFADRAMRPDDAPSQDPRPNRTGRFTTK